MGAEELCFIITNVTTGAERKFQKPPFPDETRRKFYAFCDCAQSLNECSFVKNPSSLKDSILFANDGSATNKGVLPSDDDIGAFLHRLRPIYLNDEETNFNKIANLVGQHIADPDVTEAIRYWKKYYDGSDSQKIFTVKIKGKTLNSDEFFNNYVNSLEYHNSKLQAPTSKRQRKSKLQISKRHRITRSVWSAARSPPLFRTEDSTLCINCHRGNCCASGKRC